MARIGDKPILWYLFEQLRHCRMLDCVILATTIESGDDVLAKYAANQGWSLFRGSEKDVLARYYHAAMTLDPAPETAIVRLTGDDILTDPCLIDGALHLYEGLRGHVDFICTDQKDGFPYGAGVELCAFHALETAFREAREPEEREHVFPFIKKYPDRFRIVEIAPWRKISAAPLSIDRPNDLRYNEKLINEMLRFTRQPFHLRDVLTASRRLERESQPL
jgi:spore coat polysaccharide biosynthesis protein SpsF